MFWWDNVIWTSHFKCMFQTSVMSCLNTLYLKRLGKETSAELIQSFDLMVPRTCYLSFVIHGSLIGRYNYLHFTTENIDLERLSKLFQSHTSSDDRNGIWIRLCLIFLHWSACCNRLRPPLPGGLEPRRKGSWEDASHLFSLTDLLRNNSHTKQSPIWRIQFSVFSTFAELCAY